MNIPLTIAGSPAILGASIHEVAGEVLVGRTLGHSTLPSTPFGGPRATMRMIHVTWHLTTIAFSPWDPRSSSHAPSSKGTRPGRSPCGGC